MPQSTKRNIIVGVVAMLQNTDCTLALVDVAATPQKTDRIYVGVAAMPQNTDPGVAAMPRAAAMPQKHYLRLA